MIQTSQPTDPLPPAPLPTRLFSLGRGVSKSRGPAEVAPIYAIREVLPEFVF